MGDCCQDKACAIEGLRERQGKVLRIVLLINLALFIVEFGAGLLAGSTSLMADSLDSLGDALVYVASLYVLGKSEQWRAGAAMLKGVIMLGFGIVVAATLVNRFLSPIVPAAEMIGGFGMIALVCNATCLYLLTRHRRDDINMESVWLCSRNDIVANVGVLVAGVGVAVTGSMWPDFIVGSVIAILFLKSAFYVIARAWQELRLKPALDRN